MRIAAVGAILLFALASCSTTESAPESPFQQPNQLMGEEITRRIEQIPYQHKDELLQNLLWLSQAGEQTIPALVSGLGHQSPKVRSSCCWVLGRLRDRRTIPNLQTVMKDAEASVRMEAARSLVLMGDLVWAPTLIEGLDSDRREVRYLCHEALATSTGHDFGYDHLNQDQTELRTAVLRWRQWWSDYSGDAMFAQVYQQKHSLAPQFAAPAGETKPATNTMPNPGTNGESSPNGVMPEPMPTSPTPSGAGNTAPNAGNGADPARPNG